MGKFNIAAVIGFLVLGYVCVELIVNLAPSLLNVNTDNITNPIVATGVGIAQWLIPLAAVVGLIMVAVGHFGGAAHSRSRK